MKKIILIAVILLGLNSSFSQEMSFKIPDYELIKKDIQDKNSNYYYPKLLDRLTANDTLLTNDEYRHLYFGYIFNPKYDSYFRSPNEEELNKYYNSEKIEAKDYDIILKLAQNAITAFPFDLKQLNFIGYIYHLKGDEATSKKMAYRFEKILTAIVSSGNGQKCETGFHVISVSHEYALLNVFELDSTSQSLVGNCDYLSFEKGKYKIDGLYFNIQKMLENEREHFK